MLKLLQFYVNSINAPMDLCTFTVHISSPASPTHLTFMGTPAQPDQDQFCFRRAAFYSSLKSKVGLIAAKAATLRVNMNTDRPPIASHAAS